MPRFGKKSKELREYLCNDLKRLVDETIKIYDFSIVDTFRGKEDQEYAFLIKASKAHFGESAHNYHPCFAVDVWPYPCPRKMNKGLSVIDDDSPEWQKMTDTFKKVAKKLGIKITCGIDFKSLRDCPHLEISGWKKIVQEI